MIVKNESENLSRLLPIIKPFVEEMIVVDTGSYDDSVKIANSFGAKVINYDWNDDFSQARNVFIENATKNWVLFLDADELIPKKYLKNLDHLYEMGYDAFTFTVREYSDNEFTPGFKMEPGYGFKGYFTYTSTPRLFRNNKYQFEFPVHETIEPSIKKSGGKIVNVDIPIIHLEKNKGEEYYINKQKKYLQYQIKFLEKEPNNIKIICDIALAYFKFIGDFENAEMYLNKAKEIDPNNSRIYIIGGELALKNKKINDAIENYEKLIKIGKELDTAYFNLGQIYKAVDNKKVAIKAYKQAIEHGSQHKLMIEKTIQQLQSQQENDK